MNLYKDGIKTYRPVMVCLGGSDVDVRDGQ